MNIPQKPSRITLILSFLFLIILGIGAYYLISYIIFIFRALDNQVAAAIIASMGTVLAAVGATLYVQKRTKEREIFEAHRQQKIEMYNRFMELLSGALSPAAAGEEISSEEISEKYIEFFKEFTRVTIVWASPEFIRAFQKFRIQASEGGTNVLFLVDDILREIRADLKNSNQGIERGGLVKMFLKDPTELDAAIVKEIEDRKK
jgi:hypothetical protein